MSCTSKLYFHIHDSLIYWGSERENITGDSYCLLDWGLWKQIYGELAYQHLPLATRGISSFTTVYLTPRVQNVVRSSIVTLRAKLAHKAIIMPEQLEEWNITLRSINGEHSGDLSNVHISLQVSEALKYWSEKTLWEATRTPTSQITKSDTAAHWRFSSLEKQELAVTSSQLFTIKILDRSYREFTSI